MGNKELRRLKRRDLLQMLLAQCEETERLQKELDETRAELETLQEGYERLKKKLDIKDERLNQKDAKIAELKVAVEEIQASRVIELEEAGSIAEAALRLNGIFEAAQRCAEQYLMNVKRISRNTPDRPSVMEHPALPGELEMTDDAEAPEQLAVPEERNISRTFAITDRRQVHGQKIPYEAGWRPAARRKKFHG